MSVNNQYCSEYRKKVDIDIRVFKTRSWRVLGTILIKRVLLSIWTISILRFDIVGCVVMSSLILSKGN